jgi:hypothetical protein
MRTSRRASRIGERASRATLGPLLLFNPGSSPTTGSPPALDLSLSPEWHPSPPFLLRALLAIPLVSLGSITSTDGSASLTTWLAGAAIDWQLRSPDASWTATLGAGAAAVFSSTQGNANPGYSGSGASAVAALPFVEGGVSRALDTRRVRLGIHGMLGASIPEITIQFANHQVASWGQPVVAASLALEIDLL